MEYTSIGISEELKKELAFLKLKKNEKTFETLIRVLIENSELLEYALRLSNKSKEKLIVQYKMNKRLGELADDNKIR